MRELGYCEMVIVLKKGKYSNAAIVIKIGINCKFMANVR